jgi:hypothetical protein
LRNGAVKGLEATLALPRDGRAAELSWKIG